MTGRVAMRTSSDSWRERPVARPTARDPGRPRRCPARVPVEAGSLLLPRRPLPVTRTTRPDHPLPFEDERFPPALVDPSRSRWSVGSAPIAPISRTAPRRPRAAASCPAPSGPPPRPPRRPDRGPPDWPAGPASPLRPVRRPRRIPGRSRSARRWDGPGGRRSARRRARNRAGGGRSGRWRRGPGHRPAPSSSRSYPDTRRSRCTRSQGGGHEA